MCLMVLLSDPTLVAKPLILNIFKIMEQNYEKKEVITN